MNHFPQHYAGRLLENGFELRTHHFSSGQRQPTRYVHQDDYYLFAYITEGEAGLLVDFKEYRLYAGNMLVVQPGQLHRFMYAENADGFLLLADAELVDTSSRSVLDHLAYTTRVFDVNDFHHSELLALTRLLGKRRRERTDDFGIHVMRRYAQLLIGVIADALRGALSVSGSVGNTQRERVLEFMNLMKAHLYENRQPAFYADLLHITPALLNETLRSVTGFTTSQTIRNEVVLQAKRLLAHTTLSVKEISFRLGFDDFAYFSRVFSQVAGVSPSAFRQKNACDTGSPSARS